MEARFERPAGAGVPFRKATKLLENTVNRFLAGRRFLTLDWSVETAPLFGAAGPLTVTALVLRGVEAAEGEEGARYGIKSFSYLPPPPGLRSGAPADDPAAEARRWVQHARVEALHLHVVRNAGTVTEVWVFYRHPHS